MEILRETGNAFTTTAEREIVRDVKEKHCYIALDFEAEKKKFADGTNEKVKYELPDGNVIEVGDQLIRTPEVLYQPSLIGKESGGVDQATFDSINKCDVDIRRTSMRMWCFQVGPLCFLV